MSEPIQKSNENCSEKQTNDNITLKKEEKDSKDTEAIKFVQPQKKSKEEIAKNKKKNSDDDENEQESEDYVPSDDNDVSISNDGEKTSEHSDEFNLEDYLNYCNSHPLDDDNEDEENECDDKPSKKIKKNPDDEEDMIISSKDLKDKKTTKK